MKCRFVKYQMCFSRYAGQVGYIICNMRNTAEAQIGDTFCHEKDIDSLKPLQGFKPAKAMVVRPFFFCNCLRPPYFQPVKQKFYM